MEIKWGQHPLFSFPGTKKADKCALSPFSPRVGRTNEWQSFRTKKDRSLELKSVSHECVQGRRNIAVEVVDIFGNDTITIVDVHVGGKI